MYIALHYICAIAESNILFLGDQTLQSPNGTVNCGPKNSDRYFSRAATMNCSGTEETSLLSVLLLFAWLECLIPGWETEEQKKGDPV